MMAAGKRVRYLLARLRRLERAGAKAARDEGEARRVILANRFALSYFLLAAPYFPVLIAFGMHRLAWCIPPMLAWHSATLILNARGWTTAARVSLGVNAMISVLFTALALGRGSGAHNLLLAASLNFLILFDWGKERRIMAWGLAADSALYLGYQWFGPMEGMFYAPTPLLERLLRVSLSLANLAGLFAGIGHFLAGSARAERALIAAREKAQAADKIKSRFIANMSHEIRTPLNIILGLARLMEAPGSEPKRREFLANIRSSAADLVEILNDALDLSKIEAGRIELERKPFRLDGLAESVLAGFRMQAAGKGLALRFEGQASAAGVLLGDALRLRQVLNNLVSNALKFTPAGSVTLRIAPAGVTGEKRVYRFEVADTGIGIEAEAQSQLFVSFRQADGSIARTHGGSGLGLAICKGLVELMGGSIGLESRPGQGTTVHFTAAFLPGREDDLPPRGDADGNPGAAPETDRPAAAGSEAGTSGRRSGAGDGRSGNLRILIVDDHPLNRMVLRNMLEARGFPAEEAADGEAAVRACSERPYDLLFMDYHMPVMDGLECTRRIRALGGARPVIVGITADALPESRAACLAAGMDRVILKPVDPADLRPLLAPWESFPGEAVAYRPGAADSEWLDAERLGNLVRSTRLRDPAIRNRAWEQFRSDTEALRRALRAAGQAGNARELKDAAHGLKGLCLTMGLTRLADACRRIEVVSQEEGRGDWTPALADLEAAYGPSLADLGRALLSRPEA